MNKIGEEIAWDDTQEEVEWDTQGEDIAWDDQVDEPTEDLDLFSKRTAIRMVQAADKTIASGIDAVMTWGDRAFSGPEGDAKQPAFIDNIKEFNQQFMGGPEGPSSGFAEDVAVALAGSAPFMIAQAINAPIGIGLMFASMYGDKHDQLIKEGKSEDVANKAATLHGLLATPAEFLGNALQFGAFTKLAKGFGKGLKIGPRIRKIAGAWLQGGTGESVEEYTQAGAELLADIYAENPKASSTKILDMWNEKFFSKEFQKEAGYQAAVGGVVGLLFPMAGTAINLQNDLSSYIDEKQTEIFNRMGLSDKQRKDAQKSPSDMKKANDLNAQFEDKEDSTTVETATSGETLTKEDTSIVEQRVATGAEYEEDRKSVV